MVVLGGTMKYQNKRDFPMTVPPFYNSNSFKMLKLPLDTVLNSDQQRRPDWMKPGKVEQRVFKVDH